MTIRATIAHPLREGISLWQWLGLGGQTMWNQLVEGNTPAAARSLARICDHFLRAAPSLLCAIQVYETVDPGSLTELTARFDWSSLRVYDLDAPGQNHGIVLGTRGWTP